MSSIVVGSFPFVNGLVVDSVEVSWAGMCRGDVYNMERGTLA